MSDGDFNYIFNVTPATHKALCNLANEHGLELGDMLAKAVKTLLTLDAFQKQGGLVRLVQPERIRELVLFPAKSEGGAAVSETCMIKGCGYDLAKDAIAVGDLRFCKLHQAALHLDRLDIAVVEGGRLVMNPAPFKGQRISVTYPKPQLVMGMSAAHRYIGEGE